LGAEGVDMFVTYYHLFSPSNRNNNYYLFP